MISLHFVFWIFIFLAALIGTIRGWAKELLVAFSVILAMFIIRVIEGQIPYIRELIIVGDGKQLFVVRTTIVLILAFFGYQTPNIRLFHAAARREKLQDSLLGAVLGGVNGYLIIGTIWHFLHQINYPFDFITAPDALTPQGQAALRFIEMLPPTWLGEPGIYFAIAVAFAFVLIVFI